MTPIHIVATTVAGTGEAIATAADLARGRHARVHVIAARPMPLESSLDQQAGAADAFAREIRRLTEASPAAIDVLPCVCRRLMDVTQLLPHGAFVIVAGQSHRWWPTREQRLAHDLHALGYRVLFIHTPDETTASSDE